MPNIQPISELRNYSSLLESVTPGQPVYLTKNGHGEYVIMSMADQEEHEQLKATLEFLFFNLDKLMGVIYNLRTE